MLANADPQLKGVLGRPIAIDNKLHIYTTAEVVKKVNSRRSGWTGLNAEMKNTLAWFALMILT
jgi:hypothetical protein